MPGRTEQPTWDEVATALGAALGAAGFAVLGAVRVTEYNASLEEQHAGYRLPSLDTEHALAVVIGNDKRLWPRFLAAYEATLQEQAHPLDEYSRLQIAPAAANVAGRFQLAHALRYSFDPAPHAVAIQRLALLAGAGELAPIGLCVHSEQGPWLSLRAAVVFDVPGPAPRAAAPTCSACTERPCLAARDRVWAKVPEGDLSRASVELDWSDWLALRDACPVGRAWRYSEQQILYHYTKDLRALTRPR